MNIFMFVYLRVRVQRKAFDTWQLTSRLFTKYYLWYNRTVAEFVCRPQNSRDLLRKIENHTAHTDPMQIVAVRLSMLCLQNFCWVHLSNCSNSQNGLSEKRQSLVRRRRSPLKTTDALWTWFVVDDCSTEDMHKFHLQTVYCSFLFVKF